METIGEKLSPVLNEIEQTIWEHEIWGGGQPHYTDEGFRAAVKIFMSALLDKMFNLQTTENLDISDRAAMAESLGKEVRRMVKTYCDIDTHELYEQ